MKVKGLCKKICWFFFALFLSLLCLFESVHTKTAKADGWNKTYTSVMDDISKDSSFDASLYPDNINDKSLRVIQLAEGENKDLFVYAYQPCNSALDLVASKISLYFGKSVNGKDFTPKLYDIELVSTQGVFDKYVVKGVKVSDDAYRYYNIVAIYRPYNEQAKDEDLSIGNKDDIAYHVGQQWCAYYYNDVLTYEMNTFETVELKVQANGYVYFKSGFQWGNLTGYKTNCDAHFIAFNAEDYQIQHIYDADLTYSVRTKNKTIGIGSDGEWRYGEYKSVDVTLKDTDMAVYNDNGIKESTYTWNRICSSSDFVKQFEDQDGELYETDKQIILSSQWVFAFCETSHSTTSGTGYTNYHQYDVDDVAILRIHFHDTSGKIYNLGVVADITSSADTPSGEAGGVKFDVDWLLDLLAWIIFGIALVFLCSVFPPIVSVFAFILKIVFWCIALPFKLIGLLFGFIKRREKNR